MREKFIGSFIAELSNKYNRDDLLYIQQKLTICLDNYELSERCTDVAVFEMIPESVKIYLVSLKIQGLSDKTIKLYGLRLRQFFEYIHKPIADISATDIKVFLFKYQNDKGVSNRTLDGIRTCICSFFKWCAAEGYIDKDPVVNIKPIKYEKKQRGYLTEEEMETLRCTCKNLRDKALIEVFYSTGCRVSEIVSLNISDVDFKSLEIIVLGKGNKQRKVYINARCKIALQNYLMSRNDSNTALFVGLRNPHNRILKSGIEKIFRDLGKKAGMSKKIHPHLLRHSHASHSLQRGMPIENVRQILGHVSLDTTLIYATTVDSAVKESHRRCVV